MWEPDSETLGLYQGSLHEFYPKPKKGVGYEPLGTAKGFRSLKPLGFFGLTDSSWLGFGRL